MGCKLGATMQTYITFPMDSKATPSSMSSNAKLFHIDTSGGGGEVGWGGGEGGTDGDGGGGGGVSGGGSGGGMHVHVRVRVIRKVSNTPRGMHSSTVTTSVAGTEYNNLARSHGLQQLDISTKNCWISPQGTCNIAK